MHPAPSLSDDNVAGAEQSLFEVPSLSPADATDSKHSIAADSSHGADVGSPGSELEMPELSEAEPASPDSEPTPESLAADLNNLDLLLPEESAGEAPAEESIVLEDETPPSAEDEDAILSGASESPPVLASTASTSAGTRRDEPLPRVIEEEDPASAQSEPDDVLRDIYSRETANHVATVRAYLDREEGVSEPHAIPEEVYRACHTLSGSSKMAQARHGVRLAEPMDHWLRRVFNSGLGLLNQDLSLLSDCMLAM